MKLTGNTYYHYKFDGQPFSFTVNTKTITFTDQGNDGQKRYTVPVVTTEPNYRTGIDNSGKAYEMVEWLGEWYREAHKCISVSIQTWDRKDVYILALWPHKTYGYRGEYPQFGGESTIARLDDASAVRLSTLLDATKAPTLQLRIFGKELASEAAEKFLESVPTFGL
jgi:hypothetical protein